MNENQGRKQSRVLYQLQRIAALLFIPLLIGGLVYFYAGKNIYRGQTIWTEIQCPKGTRAHFELPDGSNGYLNSGSSLKYPIPFTGNRSVRLTGEAFFDVVHNQKSPFHVVTANLDIKVLGTCFNVLAFNDQDFEEVTLERGKVEIYGNNHKIITRLAPNQQFNLDCKTRKYNKREVDASRYISWIEGKLSFRNENFAQVAKRLSRWYNVDIIIADKQLEDYIFYATFEDEQLDEVLKLIELTTPITYQVQKREKKPDGSFGTKKVILKFSREKLNEFK